MSPQLACESIIDRIVEVNGGIANVNFNVKMIALNIDGETGVASIETEGLYHPEASMISRQGFKVITGTFMKKGGSD